jgi:hypothetical protein
LQEAITSAVETPLDQGPFIDPKENLDVLEMNLDESLEAVRKSAYWFFGIAALSLINTFMLSKGVFFILGLGLSQIIDRIMIENTGEINYLVSFVAPLAFIVIGFFGATCHRWAFVVGGFIYFIDALIYLYAQEWFAFGVHGFILYKLWKGYGTISEYEELKTKLA